MAALTLLILAIFAGSAYSAPQPGRIVGGTETSLEKFPWIVQVDSLGILSGTWGQSCAANILTTTYVLTAAHCFAGIFYQVERRRIRAGATYRNTGGVLSYVEVAINHPSYGQLENDGDIGVVRLSTPLVYGPLVQQGSIINQGAVLPDDLPVVHAGWGAVTQGGLPSPVLLETTIYTISTELCRERYLTLPFPRIVTDNMICAGLLDVGGRDACQGDSGGPLYYSDIIVGVVSWGHGCANETFPGLSTAVSSYTDWIIATAV